MTALARQWLLRMMTEAEYEQIALEAVCRQAPRALRMTPREAGQVGQRIGLAVRRRDAALARNKALTSRQRRALR